MSPEDRRRLVLQAIKDYTRKHCATPETARRALINEGIYNEDGSLRFEYGGKPNDTETQRCSARNRIFPLYGKELGDDFGR